MLSGAQSAIHMEARKCPQLGVRLFIHGDLCKDRRAYIKMRTCLTITKGLYIADKYNTYAVFTYVFTFCYITTTNLSVFSSDFI